MVKVVTKQVSGVDRVSDLIEQESNCWNSSLIRSIFSGDEANAIMSIPLPKINQMDKKIWYGEHIQDIQCIFEHSNNDNKELTAITIWALWYARNKLIHEGVLQSVNDVVTFVRVYGREYRVLSSVLRHPPSVDVARWSPLQ
ncbi:hypothetical protein Goshw_006046 [Gossypium schwendimanii]|uniref:Uncharacterized protein n=1 Tax=Gossypium schwendimanii TaxID=34291 RepID=A0A7J9MFY0_GOSSC|nr:hypothetical protein [Gossypium schwendimanii]